MCKYFSAQKKKSFGCFSGANARHTWIITIIWLKFLWSVLLMVIFVRSTSWNYEYKKLKFEKTLKMVETAYFKHKR